MKTLANFFPDLFQAEVEETLKRIQSHKGVIGTMVVNAEGKYITGCLLDTQKQTKSLFFEVLGKHLGILSQKYILHILAESFTYQTSIECLLIICQALC